MADKKKPHGSYFQNKKKYYDTLDQADYESNEREETELDNMSKELERYGDTDTEREIFDN